MTSQELAWAAGFLEGEGYFGRYKKGGVRIGAAQVQKELLIKLKKLFGGQIYRRKANPPGKLNFWAWQRNGRNAIGVMFTLFTYLSRKRKTKIKEIVKAWGSTPSLRIYSIYKPRR